MKSLYKQVIEAGGPGSGRPKGRVGKWGPNKSKEMKKSRSIKKKLKQSREEFDRGEKVADPKHT